jgi:uncharacterized protein (TIGR00299 family) protein
MTKRKIAYFNPFSGISGDMTLGAFVNAGLPFDTLVEKLKSLNLDGYELSFESVSRHGITATKINVDIKETHHHRHLSTIEEIINKSSLDDSVKKNAIDIFRNLAKAEADVHGIPVEKVHFHEVGAVDAIIDIVGACVAIHELGITEIYSAPLALGGGTVKCAHGIMPVPAPATAKLLQDIPCYGGPADFELTTPTGAAIIKTFSAAFGFMPPLSVESTGFGAGSKEFDHANVLHLIIGKAEESFGIREQICEIVTNIDDMTPEAIGWLTEKLLAEGAKDVCVTPVQMKKNRPGVKLSIMCAPGDESKLGFILLRDSSTRGYRIRIENRVRLSCEILTHKTRFGDVRIKKSTIDEQHVKYKPEYDDIRRIADEQGMSFGDVRDAVMEEFGKSD